MKQYMEMNVEILRLDNTDIITESSFWGETDGFSSPNNAVSDEDIYSDNG